MIRRRREELRLSQAQLALKARLHRSSIHRIERGENHRPAPNDLAALASALHLAAADLFVLAGYTTPHDLPSFPLYLHVRYAGLPAGARERLEAVFMDVVHEKAA